MFLIYLLHCMYNCIAGFCCIFLSQICQIICFLVGKLYLNVSSHHKFSFFNTFTQTLSPIAKTKCDKSFSLVFPNTNFPFLTDSLKHPAKCDKRILLVFHNAVCISYWVAFKQNNFNFLIKTVPYFQLI